MRKISPDSTITPIFCIHVHGAKSKEDVHYFGRQQGHGPLFLLFPPIPHFSHPNGRIVINDESMMNYVTGQTTL